MRQYFVYMLASTSRCLYVGVTSDLVRRLWEHRNGLSTHTARYRIRRLVYFEATDDPSAAIAREKEIKGWSRAKKKALIARENPHWRDLARQWFDR